MSSPEYPIPQEASFTQPPPLSTYASHGISLLDASTANRPSLNGPSTNQPFHSFIDHGSNLASRTLTMGPELSESSARRAQLLRRSFAPTPTGAPPSLRKPFLGSFSGTLVAEAEMVSMHGESCGTHGTATPSLRAEKLSLLDEGASSSLRMESSPLMTDREPLLRRSPPRTVQSGPRGPSYVLVGACLGRENRTEGVLDRSTADPELGVWAAPAASDAGVFPHNGGVELSVDGMTLTSVEHRFLRGHVVTYLDRCSLHIHRGSLHCVISSNPAHSRCVLAVLAGVEAAGHAEGVVLANDVPTHSHVYRRRMAYVTSLDGCMLESTVEENLAFSTRLRFNVDEMTAAALIREAATETLLTDLMHVPASRLSLARRYLLAVAMELVAEPTVLLLDGPLSFFSSAELQMFVQSLGTMRRRHPLRTVVWSGTTIPWTLFDTIDSLTLISTGGATFFTGRTKDVESFLQEDLGILRVPAEDVVDIMAQTELDSVAVANASTAFRNSRYYSELQNELEAHRAQIAAGVFEGMPTVVRPSPGRMRVQWVLLCYELRRNLLCKEALLPWAGLFVVIVFVGALLAFAEADNMRNIQNVCGVLFLLLSCSFQVNSIFFRAELSDWRTFQSFKYHFSVSLFPYYIATVIRLVIPRLGLALAGCVSAAVVFKQASVVSLSIMMALTSFPHACLGLVAVYWFPRLDYLLLLHNLYYGYCVIISGYLLSVASVPCFFQYVSLLRIGYGGLVATEMSGRAFGCESDISSLSASTTDDANSTLPEPCYTAVQFLELVGFANDSWGKSALVLSLLSLGIVIVLGLSMHMNTGRRPFCLT